MSDEKAVRINERLRVLLDNGWTISVRQGDSYKWHATVQATHPDRPDVKVFHDTLEEAIDWAEEQ